jgi:hypothetical protein
MSAETLVLLFAFAWGGWILYRIHQRRQKRGSPPDAVATRAPPKDRAMPRIGEPGTITFNQIQTLRRNNFTPDKGWSREEAALILDAVKYLRCVCRDIGEDDDGPPPLEVQNELLRFILTEQDLRDHVRKWGEDRRKAGITDDYADDEPELPRNNQYDRVVREAGRFVVHDEAPSVEGR